MFLNERQSLKAALNLRQQDYQKAVQEFKLFNTDNNVQQTNRLFLQCFYLCLKMSTSYLFFEKYIATTLKMFKFKQSIVS